MGRTNVDLDDRLIKEGMKLSGLPTKRALIHQALETYVRKQRLKGLLSVRGKVAWHGHLKTMRRGREWSL